jgi:hypothetical protein
MKEMETLIHMLPYMAPLVILEIVLIAVALADLVKRKKVTGGKKIIWVLVTVGVQFVGPIIYLVLGRKEESSGSD